MSRKAAAATTYNLQLDLKLCFCPPMDDGPAAIRLTRAIELPFPPFEGLAITGRAIDTAPIPEGFILKSVVWDLDRNRFTGDVSLSSIGLPFAYIRDEIAKWLSCGWSLGSYADDFPDEIIDEGATDDEDDYLADPSVTEEDIDAWPELPARARPKQFSKLFRAMIRVMCETHNALPRAYAMWKTGRLFPESKLKDPQEKPVQDFQKAIEEYENLDIDEQWDWREKICRTYPRLDRVMTDS